MKEKVEFLLDDTDSVKCYEERGRAKIEKEGSQYERGMKALQNMNRFQAVEAITEFNQFQDEFKSFLSDFAKNKRVVSDVDIKQFFEELKEKRKKRKIDVNIPENCR